MQYAILGDLKRHRALISQNMWLGSQNKNWLFNGLKIISHNADLHHDIFINLETAA